MKNNLIHFKETLDKILLYLKSIESLKEENRNHIIIILKENECLNNSNFGLEFELLTRQLPPKDEVVSILETLKRNLEIIEFKENLWKKYY